MTQPTAPEVEGDPVATLVRTRALRPVPARGRPPLRSSALRIAQPVGLTLAILGVNLIDALTLHPGSVAAGCPLGPDRLAHWDGSWYAYIAQHGYAAIPGGGQQPAAFFPLLPWLAAAVHAAVPGLALPAAGVAVNIAAVAAAMTLVDLTVGDWPRWQRAGLVVLLLTLPSAFFYATFYSEALFTLGVAIVTWAVCTPRRLAWAALGIAIASSDRVAGVALLVALAVILWLRRDQTSPRRAALLVTSSLAGVVAVLGYAAISAGNPVAFLTARSGWRGTGGVGYIPYTVRHGVASTLRLVADEVTVSPVPDNGAPDITGAALPWSLGLYADLLLAPLALAAWRVHRELGILAAVLVGATLIGGPPISQSRFALVLLPAWIGGVALVRHRRAGWAAVGLLAVAGLAVNLHLMADFANCRWAG